MKEHEKIADLTRKLLEEIGEDPKREGLVKTPSRVAKSWKFFSRMIFFSLKPFIFRSFHDIYVYFY